MDVEYSWIRAIYNQPDVSIDFGEDIDLNAVFELSLNLRKEIDEYLRTWTRSNEHEIVNPSWMTEYFKKGEILRHLIAHEIHHIGQLSIWAREQSITPVSPSFIGRNIDIPNEDH
ncbi:damage-inducible protein DinB [Paenibacillus sp. GSMTC-2017]|uniref:DinB family protein n=1 Tax=Paenibacillus sp. GSMTC-2017 TaxID=2794350 RepID=UPI0018D626A1|nr:damage-inducible protein DinB [Paenibacillus sp. GSMTC-2017]